MPDPLIIAAPLLIVAVVMAFRFVGCHFAHGQAGSPTSYTELVLGTRNLVSFWELNELSGPTADDQDSHLNPGTYQGGVTLGVASLVSQDTANTAAAFDGNTGYVEVPFAATLNPPTFAVEALVQPGVIDPINRRTIASSFERPDQTGYMLAINNTDFEASVGTGTNIITVAVHAGAQPNQSHYVAMTYDGTNLELYVDPQAFDTEPGGYIKSTFVNADINHERYNTGQVGYTAQTTSDLRIGAGTDAAQPDEFFDGVIQNVAVYQPPLSFNDIATHYWWYETGLLWAPPARGSTLAGEGTLSITAAFPANAPTTTPYSAAGTYTYDIPYWCTYVDLILLGGGGGGANGMGVFAPGAGGLGGSWAKVTVQRGVGVPWTTASIAVTVGSGGAAAINGGNTTATGAGMATQTAIGGIQGASVNGTTGASPGDTTYNGITYDAGVAQTAASVNGNAPGGGGAGGDLLPAGGAGAAGSAWIVARQA
jgi:hypothetical protein